MFKQRFLKYISFDTQSDETTGTVPSTKKQFDLARYLENELKSMGIENAYCDEHCYVYGYLESNCNSKQTIGLIAHLDTSDEASGKDVKPNDILSYDGKTIKLNEKLGKYLDPNEFPRLNKQIGHNIITTDGTTLLGADDKAGIAIIMTVIEELLHSNIERPNILVTFTPDEEIGGGTAKFNYDLYKKFNCDIAYTLDGGELEVINYENFNASSAKLVITGKSIHPGSAKNKMINASLLAMEFNQLLPSQMRPEHTENYEGFNHLSEITGSVTTATMHYILRNHDLALLQKQKESFIHAREFMVTKYPEALFDLTITNSYFNMIEKIKERIEIVDIAKEALKINNITPVIEPIRGGTDGAHLTFNGVYTPNLGTGGYNYHGPLEYLDVNESLEMIKVVKTLLNLYTKKDS